jgi:hypothetical protein
MSLAPGTRKRGQACFAVPLSFEGLDRLFSYLFGR